MITLILKNYFAIILSIAITAISLIVVGSYCLIRRFFSTPTKISVKTDVKKQAQSIAEITDNFTAIAGDDLIATQLDLARAYIETDKRDLAKSILKTVTKQGNQAQKDEAQELLSYL